MILKTGYNFLKSLLDFLFISKKEEIVKKNIDFISGLNINLSFKRGIKKCNDKNNSVKLPVSKNGRSATQEYGVDELYNGDVVYVEGYNEAFKVKIYDNNQPQYIHYL